LDAGNSVRVSQDQSTHRKSCHPRKSLYYEERCD